MKFFRLLLIISKGYETDFLWTYASEIGYPRVYISEFGEKLRNVMNVTRNWNWYSNEFRTLNFEKFGITNFIDNLGGFDLK